MYKINFTRHCLHHFPIGFSARHSGSSIFENSSRNVQTQRATSDNEHVRLTFGGNVYKMMPKISRIFRGRMSRIFLKTIISLIITYDPLDVCGYIYLQKLCHIPLVSA